MSAMVLYKTERTKEIARAMVDINRAPSPAPTVHDKQPIGLAAFYQLPVTALCPTDRQVGCKVQCGLRVSAG